jgi:hypothetical protein
MTEAELEPDVIAALFEQLEKVPKMSFSRGCPDVPNQHGVYVIYSRYEGVLYVGRTNQARWPSSRRAYGLRRRLSQHRAKYSANIIIFVS